MHRGYQLSLLDTGQGKGQLFGAGVLEKYLEQHKTTPIPDQEARIGAIREWLESLKASEASESSLEPKFITMILCGVLGYTAHPAPGGSKASLYSKPSPKITKIKRIPDATLGEFAGSDHRFVVAVELKSPGTNLDLPQPSPSHDYETPVEQGFYYGENILGIQWVLISDMRIVRLYSVETDDEYEELRLSDCLDQNGMATETFRRLFFLLHHDYLVSGRRASQVALLYAKSAERQIKIRDSFYDVYYRIRSDLYGAIQTASKSLTPTPTRQELLEATQRLLDRLLFIYYCEDHPQQLIPNQTIERVTQAARLLPGATDTRVYESLKALFREVDVGSPAASGARVPGYNGELFKTHRIIDHIDLPDSLHDRQYHVVGPDGPRIVHGVWGLHIYDFWSELNEYLLGHIFEESLSDLEKLDPLTETSVAEKHEQRKEGGVFFTSGILADFLCSSAIQSTLNEIAPLRGKSGNELADAVSNRIDHLLQLRAVDFACGSGAFLTSIYRELLLEFWRLQSAFGALKAKTKKEPIDLFTAADVVAKAKMLPSCVFGVDQLPQAAEIAKLAVWLRSARKDEKVLDLSSNIFAADSLDLPNLFERLGNGPGTFDVVVGNPPWGGRVAPTVYDRAVSYLGLPSGEWDSWELFLLLGIRALREGGRLALVLPDSFLYPKKSRLREMLFASTNVEKVHNLGPDWFGKDVRMGTVVLQARRGPSNPSGNLSGMLLAGNLRDRAIRGEVPLTQIESQRRRLIPIARSLSSPSFEIEVFRQAEDDRIIQRMMDRSLSLSDLNGLCKRARGEEINKAGLVWICPSCLNPTTPGKKKKGGHYERKKCETCGHVLTEGTVESNLLVVEGKPQGASITFIDGDDIYRRYGTVKPTKWLRLNVPGWTYKDQSIYHPPKILVRQAGVGICATLDKTGSRCPQSVYVYQLRNAETRKGYRHEFVLGALLSRTMAYLVFKRFSEVDPAKAHAKLTHERLAGLPIPCIDFDNPTQVEAHGKIIANVRKLLDGKAKLGEEEDREVEQILRGLWGLTSEDGAYMNGEFHDLPDSQIIRDLFPEGPPSPVLVGE